MFTGLIEETGKITNISKGINSAKLNIESEKVLKDIKIGDSIAVNGVCLTVTDFGRNSFTVDVMAETLRRSNLGNLNKKDKVNLERAMAIGERLGGHIVSGHIDGKGKVIEKKDEDIATWITIEASKEILNYIVLKGSIAIDGISLTVAEVGESFFKVSLIPLTKGETTLYDKSIGEEVNLECDIIGKYVERLLFMKERNEAKNSSITEELLIKNGFI